MGAGIWSVGTAGHGGVKLDRERNAAMPACLRLEGGWYEEDCEWARVALVFPGAFSPESVEMAAGTLKNWHPDIFEEFFKTTIKEGESLMRDQALFDARHKDDYVVKAAFGDWDRNVPKGMVGVVASKGGSREAGSEEAWFLVPAAEYEGRDKGGFVIDEARHKRIERLR
jgi:hypothetical protein